MPHLSWGHLSISAISQLLLARFGPNFKQRVQGTYTTDYNCHHGICPGNICPGDICPYQQYKYFQAEHFRLQSCIIQYILCNTYYRIHFTIHMLQCMLYDIFYTIQYLNNIYSIKYINRLKDFYIYRMTDQWTNRLSYKVQENQLYGLNTQDALKNMINSW